MNKELKINECDAGLVIHPPCGEIILEIKSSTDHFLTFSCTLPKDHNGDCILNLSFGDTEIEIRNKREVDRHEHE